MEEETLVAALEHVVNQLLVHLCTECTCRERLCLATCEDRASVRHRQRRNLAPDRTDVCSLTTVETLALVEDATAHRVAHNVSVVAHHFCVLLVELLSGEVCVSCVVSLLEVRENLVESLLARLLVVVARLCDSVALVVGLLAELLAEFLVVHLVAVLALNVCAKLLRELCLQFAHRLDSSHSSLQRANHVLLRNFLHLALYHHDVLCRSAYHDIHVGILHLLEGRVDNVLAVDACYTHF